MNLGSRIREIREDQGLNQAELAARVETSQSTISQLERGDRNPSYQMLRRLAEALSVSVSYLLGEDDLEELTPEEEVHFREYRGLSNGAKRQLKEYMRFLKQTRSEAANEADEES